MNLFKSLSALSLAVAVLGGAVLAPSSAHAASNFAHHMQKKKAPVFKRIVLPPEKPGLGK